MRTIKTLILRDPASRFPKARLMVDLIPCPHCGAEIDADARFCRHCGSSDSDGWREETESDFDDFDYDEYVADNFPSSAFRTSVGPLWRVVAVVLLLLFLLGFLLS